MSTATESIPRENSVADEKTNSERASRSDEEHKGDGETSPEGEAPEVPLSPMHEIAFIFVICMAQFLALAGLAQSVAPLGIIGRGFDVTNEAELSWYPAAFSLTVGTFILPAGRLVSVHTSTPERKS